MRKIDLFSLAIVSLAATTIASSEAGTRPQAAPFRVEKLLSYGAGPNQLGVIKGGEHAPLGPESFAIGRDGELIIGDLINNRLMVYSDSNEFVRAIPISKFVINDLALDRNGNIYIYDHRRRIIGQFSPDGRLVGQLLIDPAAVEIRGYLHIADSSIYFANSANKDVLIANIRDGLLTPPDSVLNRQSDGVHSETGTLYAIEIERERALRVRVQQVDARKQDVTLLVPTILSAAYVGEDSSGRFYIQVEKIEEAVVILDVLIFDASGAFVGNLRIPQNNYSLWTTKLLAVRSNGMVVQFLPERDQVRLQVFSEADAEK